MDSLFGDLCGNEVFQEVLSPDGTYKAVVFQRDCGATTGFSTQVSILKASSQLANRAGNVFAIDGHPDWTQIRVRWDGNRAMNLDYPSGYDVSVQKSQFWDFLTRIEIYYQVRPEP